VESAPHEIVPQRSSSRSAGNCEQRPEASQALQTSQRCPTVAYSQRPAAPHVPLQPGSPRQVPCGSVPAATRLQSPGVRLHASHSPLHAVLQHTPSVQKPARHSLASMQAAPVVRFPEQLAGAQHVPSL
jgi:hypothetical protein